MDRSQLEALIVRLESLGYAPKNIYQTLAKRFDSCLVEKLIGEITGWYKREPKAEKRIVKPKRVPKPKPPSFPKGPRKGHPISPEARAKIAAAKTRWWQEHRHEVVRFTSEETRAKIAAASRAHRASPETRAKMSLSMKLRWQEKKRVRVFEHPDPQDMI